jgi:hypothetical protein
MGGLTFGMFLDSAKVVTTSSLAESEKTIGKER